jgi:pyruvate dehydrogenase E1 component alpha subunit
MEKVIEKFEVRYLQVLNENGKVDEKLMPKISSAEIKRIYEGMVLTRVFDEKALKLQRQGRMGTYAPVRGQEAQVASAVAMGKEDFVFPAFRENGVFLARGVPPEQIYQYWYGDERGSCIPVESRIFPVSITVGAHPLHAVGYAMAMQRLKKKVVTITYFGDGATSEGDCLEAFNFAGAFKAPVVFICQNNGWAISLPVSQQTAASTLAQKAIAFGFEGVRVDGNDVFAVYKAVKIAVEKARMGGGPTLIEMLTYRMADHTTSDEAKKYRREEEVIAWGGKDPILRLKNYMSTKKMGNEKYFASVVSNAEKIIENATLKYEKIPFYKPEEIFNYMYKELTPDLREQQAWIKTQKFGVEKKVDTSGVKEKGAGVVGELEEAK